MLKHVKQTLRKFIDANQFSPTFAGVLVNPFWLCRQELSRYLKKYGPRLGARRPLTQLLLSALLFAPVSLLASLLAIVLPANPNTYLDNLILARRVAP